MMSLMAHGLGRRATAIAAAAAATPRQRPIHSIAFCRSRGMSMVAATTTTMRLDQCRILRQGTNTATFHSSSNSSSSSSNSIRWYLPTLALNASRRFATNNIGNSGSGTSDVPGCGTCLAVWAGLGLTCYAYGSFRLWYVRQQEQINDLSRTAQERMDNIKQLVDDIQSDAKLSIDRTRERLENVKSKAKERIKSLDGTALERLENTKSGLEDRSDLQETINRFQKLKQEVKERLDQSAILHVGNDNDHGNSSSEIMSHGDHHIKNDKGNPIHDCKCHSIKMLNAALQKQAEKNS